MTRDPPPPMAAPARPTWSRRGWIRLAAIGLAGTAVLAAILIAPALAVSFVPRAVRRSTAIGVLMGIEAAYVALWAACLIGVPWLVVVILRARRQGRRRPLAARLLLISISALLAGVASEAAAAIWHSWSVVTPELPFLPEAERPPDPRDAPAPRAVPDEIFVVVVGESSAEGVPHHGRLSIGEIVAWGLRKALPGKKVRVEVQARSGMNLDRMQRKLSGLARRPDVLIVYAGHNEFSSRYPWFHGWPHYVDYRESRPLVVLERLAERASPLCRLIRGAVASQRVDEAPPPWITRGLVDVPVYTPEEYAARLADFRTRLDAMAEWSRSSGAATVLVLPPANDAGYEPNRSSLSPNTLRVEREEFARVFLEARRDEGANPAASEASYRAMLVTQPDFAEAHFRLARLLGRLGRAQEAYPHFVAARDLDGLPMRCPTDFQEAYREVASRRGAGLVDGQAIFRSLGEDGLLGDDLFHDAMHPSLAGHVALAQGVLERLRERPELGWPEGAPVPRIDPIECAAHFGVDRRGWIDACTASAAIWRFLAYSGHDPTERLAKARRFDRAVRDLEAGRSPESLGVPGVGLSPTKP